jgi:hypothetical protein
MNLPLGLAIDVHDGANPWTSLDIEEVGRRFTFTLVSDRTGGARPGVFQRALACTDLLAPSFAIQLGDLIEGYTDDGAELSVQWDEIDEMLAELRTPMFHLPGNHDVSTPVMEDVWTARYGRRYHHFRFHDVLFCLLDTQDPPFALGPDVLGMLRDLEAQIQRDPAGMRAKAEAAIDWNGLQPATVSEEQQDYFARVLRDHADARWTILCMHMPIWQGDSPEWQRIRGDGVVRHAAGARAQPFT